VTLLLLHFLAASYPRGSPSPWCGRSGCLLWRRLAKPPVPLCGAPAPARPPLPSPLHRQKCQYTVDHRGKSFGNIRQPERARYSVHSRALTIFRVSRRRGHLFYPNSGNNGSIKASCSSVRSLAYLHLSHLLVSPLDCRAALLALSSSALALATCLIYHVPAFLYTQTSEHFLRRPKSCLGRRLEVKLSANVRRRELGAQCSADEAKRR